MQARYAVVRGTVTQYTLPVPIPKNTSLPFGNSDEDSDGPPPSPKKTDAIEMKINKSLQVFIKALPHLEPLHYGFELQASNEKGYCICSLAKCLTPWKRKYNIFGDHSMCGIRLFQGYSLLQHCDGKGDKYHTATAFKEEWDRHRLLFIMGKMINQESQLMQTNKFLVVIINLLTVKNQTISTKGMKI
jgi:hypothetical protein